LLKTRYNSISKEREPNEKSLSLQQPVDTGKNCVSATLYFNLLAREMFRYFIPVV